MEPASVLLAWEQLLQSFPEVTQVSVPWSWFNGLFLDRQFKFLAAKNKNKNTSQKLKTFNSLEDGGWRNKKLDQMLPICKLLSLKLLMTNTESMETKDGSVMEIEIWSSFGPKTPKQKKLKVLSSKTKTPQEWPHKSSNTNFLWESFRIATLHWTMLLFLLSKDYLKQTILQLVLMLFWNTQESSYVG
jgi:hypothetical protein